MSYVATQGSDPGLSEGEGPRAIVSRRRFDVCKVRGAHRLSCPPPPRDRECRFSLLRRETNNCATRVRVAFSSAESSEDERESQTLECSRESRVSSLESNHPRKTAKPPPALRRARRTRAGPCVGPRRSSRSSRSRRPRAAVRPRATRVPLSRRWRATSTRPRRLRHSAMCRPRPTRGRTPARIGRAEETRLGMEPRTVPTCRRRTCTTR